MLSKAKKVVIEYHDLAKLTETVNFSQSGGLFSSQTVFQCRNQVFFESKV